MHISPPVNIARLKENSKNNIQALFFFVKNDVNPKRIVYFVP
jgi:hypothetical protein